MPISNNLAENTIRPFTLGRKNWLFCDTTKGAEASAIVYSLVESAKANGVEPFAYLQHVLVELPYLGKNQSHEELESFTPWAPYIQQEFCVKDSDAYVNTYLDEHAGPQFEPACFIDGWLLSAYNFPAFPEQEPVFCGAWGSASTSRKPSFPLAEK